MIIFFIKGSKNLFFAQYILYNKKTLTEVFNIIPSKFLL